MNIVFAFADDWGRYASVYEKLKNENTLNSLISTPNFDSIANEGVLFSNAFVPAPSCTPCRSSILSGRYFWQTGLGAILDGAVWDENIPSYPLELEKKDWFIGYSYKVWSPGYKADAPYGGERARYEVTPSRFGSFSQEVTKKKDELGIAAAKEELFDEVRTNFTNFLHDRPKDANFCYWCGPTNTHRIWEKGSGKDLWGIDPDDLKDLLPAFLPDAHDVREDFADYLGEAMAFDGAVGVLIDKLKEIGEFDNTLFVVSGDHGMPGIPRSKCNLYNMGCEVALAMRYPNYIKENIVVDDFVNLMDLAPTFLEMAGVDIPPAMTAKSMVPLLRAQQSGWVDTENDYVITGRERHVRTARENQLPYPQRAIHTKDYLYIVNFEPDRWPSGTPNGLENPDFQIEYNELRDDYRVAYSDIDCSPTKAFMVCHRNEEQVKKKFELGFGKRPYEELYDLNKDEWYMLNVAQEKEYEGIKEHLKTKLFDVLIKENDPRVTEECCRYETSPYTD